MKIDSPRSEALAFGIFGGITLLGFLLSFGIRGANLEAEDWDETEGDEEEGITSDENDDDDDYVASVARR